MADDITLNTGSGGATLAADDISSVWYQRVKLTASAADSTEELSKAEDTVHTTGDSGIMALAVRNDTLAALAGTDGDYTPLQVNNLGALFVEVAEWAGGNPVSLNNGTADAGTLRVTIASDSTGVVSIDDNGANLSVDWAGTAPPIGAGVEATALRVTLATDSTGVVSIDDNGGDISIDWAGTAPPIGAGTEAAALRVTLATDSTGVISIDDNAGSLTVDGTVTANLSATDNAVLDAIAADTATLAAAVSTEMQVDVVAALPAGTNAIGKLAANSGVDIGDVDILSIAAGSNLIGDVGIGVRTSGGTSTYYDADLDETAVAVKASAGNIYSIVAFNTTAAPLFLQLFNVAQGSVTVGTTTPTNQYVVPGNADSDGAGFVINLPAPKSYGTAITAACSTDSEGNGAPGVGACIVNIEYA